MAAAKGNKYAAGHGYGRPTEYKEEFCDLIQEHMSKGYSYESFAGLVGVCKQTLYNWSKEHKDFLDASNRARERCRYWWETIMVEHIVHTQRGKRVDPRMWEFNMKNRFKDEWKDEVIQQQHQTITQVNPVVKDSGTQLESKED